MLRSTWRELETEDYLTRASSRPSLWAVGALRPSDPILLIF